RVQSLGAHTLEVHETDIRDREGLRAAIADKGIDSVIHLAGLKAVGESVEKPMLYYDNNVAGTITLIEVLVEAGVRKFVFSSSATVYGTAATMPIVESA